MKQFFTSLLASCLGFIIAFLLLIGIFALTISSVVSSAGEEETVDVKENSVLYITLNHGVVDHAVSDGLPFGGAASVGLDDILKSLKNAATDDDIKGIFMEINGMSMGMASCEELRNALLEFKKSKKLMIK